MKPKTWFTLLLSVISVYGSSYNQHKKTVPKPTVANA